MAQKRIHEYGERPTVVCLCGSARFTSAVYEAYLSEALKSKLVLTYLPDRDSWNTREWHDDTVLKVALDELHYRRIDLADEILVLNVGGYIGKSTAREVAYAKSQGKKIRYWEERP